MTTFLYDGQHHTIASYLQATKQTPTMAEAVDNDLWSPAERREFLDNEQDRRLRQLIRENPGAGVFLEKTA